MLLAERNENVADHTLDEQTVGLAECIREIDSIVLLYPNVINPTEEDRQACLYYKENPRGNEHYRCIIGELAHRLGWPAPALGTHANATSVAARYDWPVTRNTAILLRRIQMTFDDQEARLSPLPWQSAWRECIDRIPEVRAVFSPETQRISTRLV